MPEAVEGAPNRPSYTVMENIVVDNVTGLTWQRHTPMVYENCKLSASDGSLCTWAEAQSYCASSSLSAALGGGHWRVPSRIELESLWDETFEKPAIDVQAFPDTRAYEYWTSTPSLATPTLDELSLGPEQRYWVVSFATPYARSYQNNTRAGFPVRCVR
jgi:hypothetical protein